MAKNKIRIVTLGCAKNQVDSERLLGRLAKGGHDVGHGLGRKADTLIINTCGFIGDAKAESIDAIMDALQAREQGKVKQVIVMGCLAQRYLNELKTEIPEVDAWFGVNDEEKILEFLGNPYYDGPFPGRRLASPPHYAYLKIAEGCSRQCSFCAIPGIRGKHISRPISEIMEEARWLAHKGVKEILLISQDLTWYGIDTHGKPMIADLVKELSDSGLFPWIRLHYLFPAAFPDSLLLLMADRSNIVPYLDIPLQHISDRILTSMRRGIGKKNTLRLIDRFREILPHAALRTSFIVGYPGETEKEFEELLEFIQLTRFERVGVFTYSEEENTPAAGLADDVAEEVKKERARRLMEVQSEISLEKNNALVGKVLQVLIDKKEGEWFIGRSPFDSPEVDNEVLLPAADNELQIGEFYQVLVEKADLYELYGSVIKK
ncbi:MAG: 30S ribosomal protein S12 methylthiotransferase RimO [Bacteroidales bacterium]|nr:30S ribosomal protein S12 methylthiotransferase RimO [Bacteroidales bacterium]